MHQLVIKGFTHVSSPVTMESRNSSSSCAYRVRNFSAEPIRLVRTTERTSHLAGFWIGAAVSNRSHSKPVLPLSNEHGSQVKDQGRWQCCHNKHKKFPYRPTRDVSLLFGHALYKLEKNNEVCVKPMPVANTTTCNIPIKGTFFVVFFRSRFPVPW